MARPPPPEPDVPALRPTERVGWGVALGIFAQLFGLGVLVVIDATTNALDGITRPVLVFLVMRITGDLARVFGATNPWARMLEGHLKAAAWAVLVLGLGDIFVDGGAFDTPWLIGLALALAGASLWGHHGQLAPLHAGASRSTGTLGALLGVTGAPLASTILPLGTPWSIVVPLSVFALVGALAARGLVRLWRRSHGRDPMPTTGWGAWYQAHFFRLTLLIAATIAYLFVRGTLNGIIPYLFLFEYGFAVTAMAIVLWTLRNHLNSQLTEDPLTSPHTRHRQSVERQGETAFDNMETAFARFLDHGDPEPVADLARDLDERGVPASTALAPLTRYHRGDRLLLIHPGWLYGGRLMTVLLVTWAVHVFATQIAAAGGGDTLSGVLTPIVLAGGIYSMQWNRYGGPWAAKTALGLAGASLLYAALGNAGLLPLLTGTLPGLLLSLVLLGLPGVHPLRARGGHPVPRYGFTGADPMPAIDRLQQQADTSLVRRAIWTLGIGLVAFVLIGELSRLVPALSVLFPIYLLVALITVLAPLVIGLGLRMGAAQVRRRHERARQHRQALYTRALQHLDHAFSTDPKRFGKPLLDDRTETG